MATTTTPGWGLVTPEDIERMDEPRVDHGHEGAATHPVVVRIPAGFRGANPTPKEDWALAVERAPLAQHYESRCRKVCDDVAQITGRATGKQAYLADAHYDEFVLRRQAPAQAGPLWFQVRQLCEKREWNWADIPATGTDGLCARCAAGGRGRPSRAVIDNLPHPERDPP